MAFIPGLVVPAPEQLRRRYGLFDAASGPLDLPSHGEGGGVRFVPVSCGGAVAYGVNCYDNPADAPDKPISGDNEEIESGVFAVLSTLNCSAVGYTLAEYRTKVRRRLEGGEQAAVERTLATGRDFQGAALGTLSFADAETVVPVTPTSIVNVVAALESYAYAENGYGGPAYIHAPIEVAAYAADAYLIQQDGTRKVTPMGSVWSFGAYPGGSITITGQTTVWRAPEISIYDAFENETNERLLVAERAYAVAFECFAGTAEFDPLEVTSP